MTNTKKNEKSAQQSQTSKEEVVVIRVKSGLRAGAAAAVLPDPSC